MGLCLSQSVGFLEREPCIVSGTELKKRSVRGVGEVDGGVGSQVVRSRVCLNKKYRGFKKIMCLVKATK